MQKSIETLMHIAIIPDGNRRWARKHNLPVKEGHNQGFEISKKLLKTAFESNVKYLTLWGASMTNLLKRPLEEVKDLYSGFERYFQELFEYEEIHDKKVRIRVLGNWEQTFPHSVKECIRKAIDVTEKYTEYNLTLLLGYNGDHEMIEAVKNIVKSSEGNPRVVTPELLRANLLTKDLPDVDLLIRTGGDPHNSVGFMMWHTANSQYYFPNLLYPEFTPQEFQIALDEYASREKRSGK